MHFAYRTILWYLDLVVSGSDKELQLKLNKQKQIKLAESSSSSKKLEDWRTKSAPQDFLWEQTRCELLYRTHHT